MHIILINRGEGWQNHLYYALSQVKVSNPRASIHLIGDGNNRIFRSFVYHHDYREYFREASEFGRVYRHHSIHGYDFELFCFQRWFILRDFLIAHKIERCFHMDPDVMVYCDLEEEAKKFLDCDFTLNSYISAHTSFWNNLAALDKFCQFIMDLYHRGGAEIYRKAASPQDPFNGFSDMTACWLFYLAGFARIGDSNAIIDGATHDINIRLSRHGDSFFEMHDGFKTIHWQGGIPSGTLLETRQKVKFNTLHCQGPAKSYMARYKPGENTNRLVDFKDRCRYVYFPLAKTISPAIKKFCFFYIIRSIIRWFKQKYLLKRVAEEADYVPSLRWRFPFDRKEIDEIVLLWGVKKSNHGF